MLPPTVVSRTNHSIAKTRPSAKSCARCALMCPLRKRSTEVDRQMEVEILDGVLATNHLVLHRACPLICEWQTAKHCSLLSSLQTALQALRFADCEALGFSLGRLLCITLGFSLGRLRRHLAALGFSLGRLRSIALGFSLAADRFGIALGSFLFADCEALLLALFFAL